MNSPKLTASFYSDKNRFTFMANKWATVTKVNILPKAAVFVVRIFQFIVGLLENNHSKKEGEIHNDGEGKILQGLIWLILL